MHEEIGRPEAVLDVHQRAKLAEIAEKTPVTRAVRAGTEIRTTTTDVR